MPMLRIREVRLPELHLPEMSRDDISRAFDDARKNVEMPDVDLSKIEMPKIDLSKVELPKIDVTKIDIPKAVPPPAWSGAPRAGRACRSSSGASSRSASWDTRS